MRISQRSMVIGAAVLCLTAPSVGWADGTTERVSVSSAEAQGNGASVGPNISGDGRSSGSARQPQILSPVIRTV